MNKSKKPQSTGPKRLPTTSNKPIRDASTAADAATVPAEGNTTSGIDRWKNDNDDVEDPYAAEYLRHKEEEKQRQRWANKKRKKKAQDAGRWVDFEQIYDPEVPTRLDDYKGSDEQANAEHEWKQLLHAHQMKKKQRTPSPEVQAQQVKSELSLTMIRYRCSFTRDSICPTSRLQLRTASSIRRRTRTDNGEAATLATEAVLTPEACGKCKQRQRRSLPAAHAPVTDTQCAIRPWTLSTVIIYPAKPILATISSTKFHFSNSTRQPLSRTSQIHPARHRRRTHARRSGIQPRRERRAS